MDILSNIPKTENLSGQEKQQHYKMIILIYASIIQPKYKEQVEICLSTWVPVADKHGIKCIFVLGEEKTDYNDPHFLYLPGVANDYMSASFKQYLGLKYISENYNFDFIFVCGTDTYPNITKLYALLNTFDKNIPMYIGGHGEHIMINQKLYYFHSGGAGFILTSKANEILYPYYQNVNQWWIKWCSWDIVNACDVSMAVLCQLLEIYSVNNEGFHACNHKNFKCPRPHLNKNIENIISCHYMSPEDMFEFGKLIGDLK